MRPAEREPRRVQRQEWESRQHLAALDGDVDSIEGAIDRLGEELKQIKSVLVGLLVTIAGAAVVGALNLLFGGA